MDEAPDTSDLKRRARRRLVGAIALVIFVVIVLPIVLDREPKPISQDLTIDIPSQDSEKFNSKLLPPTPAPGAASVAPPSANGGGAGAGSTGAAATGSAAAVSSSAAAAAGNTAATSATTATSSAQAEAAKPAPKVASVPDKPAAAADKTAEAKLAAITGGGSYFVPLGAFSKRENLRQVQSKVSAAGFKTYSEKMPNASIRVRAGPFASRDAAEQAREKLKSAGLQVGPVGKLD